jgi:hypothetical protein
MFKTPYRQRPKELQSVPFASFQVYVPWRPRRNRNRRMAMDGIDGTRRGLSQQSREFALLAPPSVVAWGNPLRKKKVFRDSQVGGRPFRGGGGKLTETTGKDRRCPGPPILARDGASQKRIFVFAFSVVPPSRTSARRGAPAVARFGRPGFQRQAPELSTAVKGGIRR